jgi:hypothetical protein
MKQKLLKFSHLIAACVSLIIVLSLLAFVFANVVVQPTTTTFSTVTSYTTLTSTTTTFSTVTSYTTLTSTTTTFSTVTSYTTFILTTTITRTVTLSPPIVLTVLCPDCSHNLNGTQIHGWVDDGGYNFSVFWFSGEQYTANSSELSFWLSGVGCVPPVTLSAQLAAGGQQIMNESSTACYPIVAGIVGGGGGG